MFKFLYITIITLLVSFSAFAGNMEYVEYDPATGVINATVIGPSAPDTTEIIVPVGTPTEGMKVDLDTLTLVPIVKQGE